MWSSCLGPLVLRTSIVLVFPSNISKQLSTRKQGIVTTNDYIVPKIILLLYPSSSSSDVQSRPQKIFIAIWSFIIETKEFFTPHKFLAFLFLSESLTKSVLSPNPPINFHNNNHDLASTSAPFGRRAGTGQSHRSHGCQCAASPQVRRTPDAPHSPPMSPLQRICRKIHQDPKRAELRNHRLPQRQIHLRILQHYPLSHPLACLQGDCTLFG